MGYPQALFKDQNIDDEFVCSICQDVMKDPVLAAPCEHVFCRDCIEQWDAQAVPGIATCPMDRRPIEELRPPPRMILNLWGKLELSCPFKGLGCKSILTLGNVADHERVCEFNPDGKIECPEGCGAVLKRGLAMGHKCSLYLKEQLAGKDKVIQTLEEQLAAKDEQIQTLAEQVRIADEQQKQAKAVESNLRKELNTLEGKCKTLENSMKQLEAKVKNSPTNFVGRASGSLSGRALPAGGNLQFIITNTKLPRAVYGLQALYDGQDSIYIIGGETEQVWKYAVSSGQISTTGSFTRTTYGAASLTNRGDILWFGGYVNASISSGIYSFSTATGRHAEVGRLPQPIHSPGLAWDADQEVGYAFGGLGANDISLDTVVKVSGRGTQATQVARFPDGDRDGAGAVWSPTEKVAYVFGGDSDSGGGTQTDIYRYVPGGVMTKLVAKLPDNLLHATAVFANDVKVYIVGHGSLMRFDPVAQKAEIVPTDNYPKDISSHAAVYVPKMNRIYVFGGDGNFDDPYHLRDWICYIDLY